jgi:hypothetical protein
MIRTLLVLCSLIALAACASDDNDSGTQQSRHGRHHHNTDPNASPSPNYSGPVSVPPGTVTNSTALRQGAIDAMGDPSSANQ